MSKPFDLAALMAPRNVALVGASDRNWSARVWDNLRRLGFRGKVFPVNPGRAEIWGTRCYASLADLPEPPDHLALFVPNDASLDALVEGGKLGARGASVFAAGFGEGGDAAGIARAKRLRGVLHEYGVAAVGPNCMGLAVGHSKLCTFPDEQVGELVAGGAVASLTQSGMLAQTLSRGIADAGLDLAYLISLGNQTGLQFADYIDHLAGDPALRVIACYIETVKDAGRFFAAAKRARDAGKKIVCVKAGGSEDARKAALAHTGSLAGSAEIFDCFAGDAGVLRLDNLEDMIEAAAFYARAKPLRGRRVAVMTNSGALKSLMTEAAETSGVELSKPTRETGAAMRAALADADVANPFDTKRTISVDEYMGCVKALHDDANTDLLLLAEEMPRAEGVTRKVRNLEALQAFVANEATKPVVVFSPLTFRETDYMRALRAGLPDLPWLRDLGKTFRVLGRATLPAAAPAEEIAASADAAKIAKWRARAAGLEKPTALNEAESKELLRDWGIPVAEEVVVRTAGEAARAAEKMGFPVVLKAVSADVPHKSDAGLVILGVATADAAREAAQDIVARCRALNAKLEGILVARQMTGGVEMVVGVHRDPEMGPAVMVGMGGVWLELFKDAAFAPPGLGLLRAKEAIATLRARKLLMGYRGGARHDIDALARALVALGRMAIDLGDAVDAVDVNPLLVLPDGARALDGLVVLRPPEEAR